MNFYFLIKVAVAVTKFQEGVFYGFDYKISSDFNYCQNGMTKTAMINYSEIFAHLPKIILVPIMIDMDNDINQYKLEILSETLQSFQLKIECTHKIIYAIQLQWYAIDSSVITVINQFNVQNLQNNTFSHQNSIAYDGFISIISLGYSGPIDFSIIIKSILADSVSIEILNPSLYNVNILSLGYQIILGPKKFIKYFGSQWQRTSFTFKTGQSNQNNFFMIPISGFDYDNLINIRLKATYSITNQYFEYFHSNWLGEYVPNLHSQILCYYIRIPYNLEKLIFNQIIHNQFFVENNIGINIDLNQSSYNQTWQLFIIISKFN